MISLGFQSLWNRRFVVGLTVFSIALSVALILGVERLRTQARLAFTNSASGIDLIVAPRGNDVQILMATVFGVGSTGTGIDWATFEYVSDLPTTSWAVPLMMGDNHRGHPVTGTSPAYFEHFRHSNGKRLHFAKGEAFHDERDAVIGSDVAAEFGYTTGTTIINAHGSGEVAFEEHDDAPFTVSGILEPTGTAVDRMVLISLEGFDALHADNAPTKSDPFALSGELDADKENPPEINSGDEHEDHAHKDQDPEEHGHEPGKINAIYVGLKTKTAILSVQRALNETAPEPLSAVLPNLALLQLWSITGTAEGALRLMAAAVAIAGMVGMVVMLSAALDSRRREFAILRSVGATPGTIFGLIVLEAVLVTLAGLGLGLTVLTVGAWVVDPILSTHFGFRMGTALSIPREALLILAILCFGFVASLLPAIRVYRMTLADGLTMRL